MCRRGFWVLVALAVSCGPAVAQEYELWIKDGTVARTKPNGQAWDAFGGLPDAVVEGTVAGKGQGIFKTPVAQDTDRPRWDYLLLIVREGDEVGLAVMDKDIAQDDGIGFIAFTITRSLIDQGERILSFDSMSQLRIYVRRR